MHIRNQRQQFPVSQSTRDRVNRRLALQKKLNQPITPKRRDFTPPRQHVKMTLRAAAQGFVWPTVA